MKRPIFWSTILVILIGAVAVWLAVRRTHVQSQPFTQTAWLAADSKGREPLAYDIVERRLLVGKSATDVELLLGPHEYGYFPKLVETGVGNVCYLLGAEHFMSVIFDDSGNVENVSIE